MMTYAEFFTFCLVIIGIIDLFLRIKKEVTAPHPTERGYFFVAKA